MAKVEVKKIKDSQPGTKGWDSPWDDRTGVTGRAEKTGLRNEASGRGAGVCKMDVVDSQRRRCKRTSTSHGRKVAPRKRQRRAAHSQKCGTVLRTALRARRRMVNVSTYTYIQLGAGNFGTSQRGQVLLAVCASGVWKWKWKWKWNWQVGYTHQRNTQRMHAA